MNFARKIEIEIKIVLQKNLSTHSRKKLKSQLITNKILDNLVQE